MSNGERGRNCTNASGAHHKEIAINNNNITSINCVAELDHQHQPFHVHNTGSYLVTLLRLPHYLFAGWKVVVVAKKQQKPVCLPFPSYGNVWCRAWISSKLNSKEIYVLLLCIKSVFPKVCSPFQIKANRGLMVNDIKSYFCHFHKHLLGPIVLGCTSSCIHYIIFQLQLMTLQLNFI